MKLSRRQFLHLAAIAVVVVLAPSGSARAQYYQPCCGGVEIVPQWEQQNRQFEMEQAQRRIDEQRRQIQEMQDAQRQQQRNSEPQPNYLSPTPDWRR